ncbi:hypothetical protein E3N88_04791 [Mikania micrantha]|uniref:Uncharacterized protein n=1 Tax=Mikania micrantha TaxID=192012 RepID=A0A5N6PWC6_9ASTR|nr:hypothetical protein E3N88_04791 [Mikania micrantha]
MLQDLPAIEPRKLDRRTILSMKLAADIPGLGLRFIGSDGRPFQAAQVVVVPEQQQPQDDGLMPKPEPIRDDSVRTLAREESPPQHPPHVYRAVHLTEPLEALLHQIVAWCDEMARADRRRAAWETRIEQRIDRLDDLTMSRNQNSGGPSANTRGKKRTDTDANEPLFSMLMLCKQSDHHDYHSRYRAPRTFRPAGKSIRPADSGRVKNRRMPSNSDSSHGIINGPKLVKPYSSSASFRIFWKIGWFKYVARTINLLQLAPTQIATCPTGTSLAGNLREVDDVDVRRQRRSICRTLRMFWILLSFSLAGDIIWRARVFCFVCRFGFTLNGKVCVI